MLVGIRISMSKLGDTDLRIGFVYGVPSEFSQIANLIHTNSISMSQDPKAPSISIGRYMEVRTAPLVILQGG
jgi:hypothetical protein